MTTKPSPGDVSEEPYIALLVEYRTESSGQHTHPVTAEELRTVMSRYHVNSYGLTGIEPIYAAVDNFITHAVPGDILTGAVGYALKLGIVTRVPYAQGRLAYYKAKGEAPLIPGELREVK